MGSREAPAGSGKQRSTLPKRKREVIGREVKQKRTQICKIKGRFELVLLNGHENRDRPPTITIGRSYLMGRIEGDIG